MLHGTLIQLNCPDARGLVARITTCVAECGGNLLEVNQYTDTSSEWFFCRLLVEGGTASFDRESFRERFTWLAGQLGAEWSIRPFQQRTRVAILVSKQDHCLVDLLWRWRADELPIDIRCVISNHCVCRETVEREGIPFIPIDFSADKEEAFLRAARVLDDHGVDLIVLARFMQILPDWLCDRYPARIINIHHSFLPAFVGANPYRRAYERGVKLIGATCHYATKELDAGPIIEQQVSRVEHYHDPDDLSRLGRDCERLALARGLRYHVEGRVLVHGSRAIVFRD